MVRFLSPPQCRDARNADSDSGTVSGGECELEAEETETESDFDNYSLGPSPVASPRFFPPSATRANAQEREREIVLTLTTLTQGQDIAHSGAGRVVG
jgi:hypothetical protein